LESSYAKTLGKTDAQIQEDKELLETITTSLANVEAAFTSFNGTIKSIKLAIESRLLPNQTYGSKYTKGILKNILPVPIQVQYCFGIWIHWVPFL
jgi:hypothetical protein